MKFVETDFDQLLVIENFNSEDQRGKFEKTFHNQLFKKADLDFKVMESYYSVSKRNVIRGMHFQLPPNDHDKLIYVVSGKILDVVIDLRRSSKTFGKYYNTILTEDNNKSLFIPKGFAHGFIALENNTRTIYNVSSVYNEKSDTGVRYDSFDFQWPGENHIVSPRDRNLITLEEFSKVSPF
tara:strand:- start:30 stop:572 length:543 start_codon:yes stop_codon:yes gene_type:complete